MMCDILELDDFGFLVELRFGYGDGFASIDDIDLYAPSDYDLRRGLSRLVSAGYLERKIKSYRLTEKGLKETEFYSFDDSKDNPQAFWSMISAECE